MPFVGVYIHYVWSTKNRFPYFSKNETRVELWEHIKQNGKEKGIFIDSVNGYKDHCHCLVSLGIDQKVSDIARLIKGESSHWINQNNLVKGKFAWQNDYFAVSVSISQLEQVRNYIRNQEEHHRMRSFQEEYDDFISKYNLNKFK